MGSNRNRLIAIAVLLIVLGGGGYFMSTALEKAEMVQATKLKPIAKRGGPAAAKVAEPAGQLAANPPPPGASSASTPLALPVPPPPATGSPVAQGPTAATLINESHLSASPLPLTAPPAPPATPIATPIGTPRHQVVMQTPEPIVPPPPHCDWVDGESYLNLLTEQFLYRINLKKGLTAQSPEVKKFLGHKKPTSMMAASDPTCTEVGCYVLSSELNAILLDQKPGSQLISFSCKEWLLVSNESATKCLTSSMPTALRIVSSAGDRCVLGVLVDVRPAAGVKSKNQHDLKTTAYITERKPPAPAHDGTSEEAPTDVDVN